MRSATTLARFSSAVFSAAIVAYSELTDQLRRWQGRKLARLVDKLIQLHRALLRDSQNAELLLVQGLTEIARAAGR
jgi:DNA polymerase-3 subunit delta